jgi:hypothetical protein
MGGLGRGLQRIATPQLLVSGVSLLLAAALAWRFADVNRGLGEVGLAAVALLYGAGLADPYLIPTGPTAHVSPVIAALIASTWSIEGVGTENARILLGLLAGLWYAGAAAVTLQLLQELGVAKWVRWVVAAVFVLLPFRLYDAVVNYWQYDQPAAALILVTAWLALAQARNGADPARIGVMLGLLAGAGGLISPTLLVPLGLGFAWLSWLCLRGAIDKRWWRGAAAGITLVAACLLPWALRNEQALGSFILTRSNFGLELAQGNAPPSVVQPGAEATLEPGGRRFTEASIDRLAPLRSFAAAQEVARLGEVAFMRAKMQQAIGWIRDDIPGFLRRCLVRLRLWLLPPQGQGYVPFTGPIGAWMLATAVGALTLPALLVLVLGRRDGVHVPVAGRRQGVEALLFVALPMAPYLVTHMNERYAYLVFFTSAAAIALAADLLLRRGAPARRPGLSPAR